MVLFKQQATQGESDEDEGEVEQNEEKGEMVRECRCIHMGE